MMAAYRGDPLPDPRETFTAAAAFLQDHHGRIDPPLSALLRLRRGDVDMAVTDGPDTLRAVYWGDDENGIFVGNAGDSYIMEIQWNSAGEVSSQSVHQFGAATTRPGSRHYADQVPMFVAMEMKPNWFNADELEPNIICRYRPGESGTTTDGEACPRGVQSHQDLIQRQQEARTIGFRERRRPANRIAARPISPVPCAKTGRCARAIAPARRNHSGCGRDSRRSPIRSDSRHPAVDHACGVIGRYRH